MPELATGALWPAQIQAITNLEVSLAQNRPRALTQMATGSGKMFTAVNFIYRLIKYGGARRVLFYMRSLEAHRRLGLGKRYRQIGRVAKARID